MPGHCTHCSFHFTKVVIPEISDSTLEHEICMKAKIVEYTQNGYGGRLVKYVKILQ